MGILNGNPKNEPLHEGEVFGVWTFISVNNGLVSIYQSFINHAGDKDLIAMLKEAVSTMKEENQHASEILKANGIALPPALPDRPVASAEEIPVGARFMDPEISAILADNVAQGLVSSSAAIGHAVREDIATMFAQVHTKKVDFGARLLQLTKEKAWLIPPPLHEANATLKE